MIRAMVFDLDGTLVQTEKLKAISYARAAVELCPYALEAEQVVEAFKQFVGRSRREVARALVERFDLAAAARARMTEFGVTKPWQAFVQVRLKIYSQLLADPQVLRQHRWPHTIHLLKLARERGCLTALATMSQCEQASHVLEVLDLHSAFDFIATRDDVSRGKPDPEIYMLVANELGLDPAECLVIEDSPSGVEAALAAGMAVVAVSTPVTGQALHDADLLPDDQIVDDPDSLMEIIAHVAKLHGSSW